ncbi:MAG: DnaA/Hda family protein [Planctomycetota bacterium]
MQALLESTWRDVQPALRAAVGDAVHDAWLAQLQPMFLERGVLHIEAPNRMVAERVMQLYRELIERELSASFGTAIGISVTAAPKAMQPDELEVGPMQPIVDRSNRTAWLLLQALYEGRALPSRQFLFHGPAGIGKSFLLQWWRSSRGDRNVVWRDATALIHAHQALRRERGSDTWREELLDPRDLVIDEVHRLAGHTRVQRDLAGVLEARAEAGVVTLLASRWHPREIREVDDRLRTWLLAGFVTEIESPGPEARLAYLRALEGPPSRNGRAEAIHDLAQQTQGGFPELRRAWTLDRLRDQPGHARRYFELIDPRSIFDRVRRAVVDAFGVPMDELLGDTQRRHVSQARKVLALLCVRAGLSRAEVGRFLTRTRAAVSYMIQSIESELPGDADLARRVEELS